MNHAQKAAEELADAVEKNIKACFDLDEAQANAASCEEKVWTEEGFRRHAMWQAAKADALTTHVSVIDAVRRYRDAVVMDKIVEGARQDEALHEALHKAMLDKTEALHKAMLDKTEAIMVALEQRVNEQSAG